MKVLANVVVDHKRARALLAEVNPPVLFYVSMLACGHWQMQRADDGTTPNPDFRHEGDYLACEACGESEADLTTAFAAMVRRAK
jgi:hypothetical protein